MRRPSAVLLALPLLALAACSGGSADGDDGDGRPAPPAASEFRAGTCRDLAEPVLATGRAAEALEGEAAAPERVAELATEQALLFAALETADADVRPALQDLVTRVGGLRIQVDTRQYDAQSPQPVLRAYDALVAACTGQDAPR